MESELTGTGVSGVTCMMMTSECGQLCDLNSLNILPINNTNSPSSSSLIYMLIVPMCAFTPPQDITHSLLILIPISRILRYL